MFPIYSNRRKEGPVVTGNLRERMWLKLASEHRFRVGPSYRPWALLAHWKCSLVSKAKTEGLLGGCGIRRPQIHQEIPQSSLIEIS